MRSGSLKWPPDKKIIFPENVKKLLRKPSGELISGEPDEVAKKVKSIIEAEKPLRVISVGDYTSMKLREAGVEAHMYIIDGKTMRKPCKILDTRGLKLIRVVNEAGTLNPEAVAVLDTLLKKGVENVVIFVEGEEDLLTLAAIISAPKGSMIIYGQPGAGNVILRVDERLKKRALEIIELALETRE